MKSDLVLFTVIHQQKRGHDLPLKSVIPRANPPPSLPTPPDVSLFHAAAAADKRRAHQSPLETSDVSGGVIQVWRDGELDGIN